MVTPVKTINVQLVFILAGCAHSQGTAGQEARAPITASAHLSFSTGLWKEGHQREANKHTSMELVQDREMVARDGAIERAASEV